MAIHWLADFCVAGLVSLAAILMYRWRRPVSDGGNAGMRPSRLHAALESSRTGTWVWEVASRYFFCDSRACQNLNARPGSLLRLEDFMECVAPSDRGRVEAEMQRASLSSEPFELVARIRQPDGAERFVALDGRPETNRRGEPIRITGSLRDVTEDRRRTLELARQSQILAQVHDAIFAASPERRILSWNEAAETMYGYTAAEAIGRDLETLWFEEDHDDLHANLAAAAEASGPYEFISPVRHRCGTELYAHFRLAPLRDAHQQTIGLLACSFDVTRRRREHEMLTLQAAALENIDDAVLVSDSLDHIVHANQAAAAMFSINRPLQGAPVGRVLAGGDEEGFSVLSSIRDALEEDGKWSGELTCVRTGQAEPVLTRASVRWIGLESGAVWVWVLRDITEQRRAEAALSEREKRFRKLASSAPMMVWMTDVDGNCEYVNEAWLNHAGMTLAEALGAGWLDAIHPDDRPAFEDRIRPGASKPQTFEIELRLRRADGETICALTHGAPRREGDALVGFVGSAVDISNIKKAEEERIHLEQQASKSQKLHSLGVLAGGIAHDFNNMLVSILGFSDLALRELELQHPARDFVEQIEIGARRAAALVDQVLTFGGKARRASEEVDINQAVFDMANLLESTLRPGTCYDLRMDADVATFLGDPAQIRQVVMNLLLNASDALQDGKGCIRVRTAVEHIQPGGLDEWASDQAPRGPCVLLEVEDDGCGMDEKTIPQIFDPFFTTKFAGRGLGLSAVMGVVRSHAGAIQVRSAVGKGSTFRVFFPVAPDTTAGPDEPVASLAGEPCVLMIDDDPTVLAVGRQMLRSGGVQAFCAQTEHEAAQALEDRGDKICLVLLDVLMPNVTAAGIVNRLRSIRSDVRILLTSGYSDAALRPPIDGHTIVGFLPKPYTRDELLDALARACPLIVLDDSAPAAAG